MASNEYIENGSISSDEEHFDLRDCMRRLDGRSEAMRVRFKTDVE
jgi:hypothetical protein